MNARPLSHWAWAAAIACHFILANGLWLWAGFLSGLLLVLPLAAAIPGLVRRSGYTAGWLTLLLVLYVAALLSEGFSIPSRRVVAIALSTVAMFEFTALVLFVRLLARERVV
ncbi:MAG: hypothetical protein NVS9B10_14630 [Nevskia sp.]